MVKSKMLKKFIKKSCIFLKKIKNGYWFCKKKYTKNYSFVIQRGIKIFQNFFLLLYKNYICSSIYVSKLRRFLGYKHNFIILYTIISSPIKEWNVEYSAESFTMETVRQDRPGKWWMKKYEKGKKEKKFCDDKFNLKNGI